MTSNISFFSMVKSDLKRRIWVTALLFLGFFAALPISGMMYADSLQSQLSNQVITFEGMIEELAQFAGPLNYGMILMVVAGSVLVAFTGFSYLHSSKKLDLFHSLPVTRRTLFFVQYVSGILVFAIPYVINLVLLLIVCIVKTVCTAAVLASLATGVILHFLYFLLLYHVAIIAIMLTGRILVSLLGLAVIHGYAVLLWQVILGYFTEWFDTFYVYWNSVIDKVVQIFSPLYLYADHVQAFRGNEFQSFAAFAGQWKHLLVLLAEIVLLLFAAMWLYRKRSSETAGRSMAFDKTKPVIKVLMMVALSLAGGLLFVGLAENDVTGWMVFGILFSALVLHCVIEVIYSYEFRKVLSHKGTLFASLAAALLIAFAFRFDWFRYDTSIPAMDRLESISVYINGLETGIYYSGEFEDAVEYGLEKGKMEEVEPGYQIAQTGVQNEKENLWENMDQNGDSDITPVDVTVAYYLKNGREKVRYYRMTQEQIDRYLPALYEEEGFKKGLNSVLGIDAERVKFDGVQMYDTYHSGRINLSPEDIAKLLQTCQQEMLEASYEEMQPEKMWGNLQFSKTGSMEDASVTVYDSFDQTLKLLEDLGYPMEKVPDIKEVSQITVYNYEPEWYLENGEVYEDPSVIFEDEKDIKEILSKVVLAEAPYFEVDSDYNVEVIVNSQDGLQSNYMQLNYQFKKNEIPSCVLEAFQNLKENQD